MNEIIIEKSLSNKNISWYYKELYNNNSDFNIKNDVYELLPNISKDNEILILYVLYKIITDNILDVNISPTPRNGLSFTDLDNKPNSLGIYHCHLKNNMVLIWYVEKDSNNDFNIKIEYIIHPTLTDNYKITLKNIYKNKDGFNTITGDYFSNYRFFTYLKDSFIQKWIFFNR